MPGGMGGGHAPGSSSLYVKNLPPEADKLYLYEKFAPYGAILSVKILIDDQTGAPTEHWTCCTCQLRSTCCSPAQLLDNVSGDAPATQRPEGMLAFAVIGQQTTRPPQLTILFLNHAQPSAAVWAL